MDGFTFSGVTMTLTLRSRWVIKLSKQEAAGRWWSRGELFPYFHLSPSCFIHSSSLRSSGAAGGVRAGIYCSPHPSGGCACPQSNKVPGGNQGAVLSFGVFSWIGSVAILFCSPSLLLSWSIYVTSWISLLEGNLYLKFNSWGESCNSNITGYSSFYTLPNALTPLSLLYPKLTLREIITTLMLQLIEIGAKCGRARNWTLNNFSKTWG